MLSEGGRKRPEVQAAVIAGMGGRLTIKIIQDSLEKFLAMDEFILQPQSEIWKVREYLAAIGCCILKEDMIFEDGQVSILGNKLHHQALYHPNCLHCLV